MSQTQITLIVKSLAILFPSAAIYWQDLDLVFREALVNDFMSYVLVLPFFIGAIFYRKRKMLKAVSPLNGDEKERRILTGQIITGISLLTLSLMIYFFGSYTSYALEYHLLSLPLFIAGTVTLVFNVETLKSLLFPISLLFFLQPYLIQLLNPFWADLAWISSTVAHYLLSTIGIPAYFTTVLEVPTIEITTTNGETIPFTVGVASSGLNSLMGFTVFSIFVIYILRDALWKRFALMLAGYPLLILINTLRITIILGLAHQWGSTVAEIFHLTGGIMLIFIGTLLLLFIGEKIWKMRILAATPAQNRCIHKDQSSKDNPPFCTNCGRLLKSINHTITKRLALRMTLILCLASLFLLIQTPPIVLAKSPTDIDLTTISAEDSKLLLPSIPEWDLQFLYRDNRVESILKQDAALVFSYVSKNTATNSTNAHVSVSLQISTGRHTWEASLVTWPAKYGRPTATVLDSRDIQILQEPALVARFFAYQRPKSNQTEVVLYWFERVPFKINAVWEMRNVQISLWSTTQDLTRSGLISSQDNLSRVEETYLPIANSITSYWQPIKTSSQITALITHHGDKMAIAVGVVQAGMVFFYALEKRKERAVNTNTYKKLSTANKQIISAVNHAQKTTTPTLGAIGTKYRGTTGKTTSPENLLQRLLAAEKTGLIKSNITNKQDEPIQTWKTCPFSENQKTEKGIKARAKSFKFLSQA